MIKAYPYINNIYKLDGNDTYYIKDKIKLHGGVWSGTFWTLEEDKLQYFPQIIKMVEVKHGDYCHEKAGIIYVTEKEFKLGLATLWCSNCDSNCTNVPVLPL